MWGDISFWFKFAFPLWFVSCIFSTIWWTSLCLLQKIVYSNPLPIFQSDCLLFDIELYFFFSNNLSDISFAKIFSHSVGCLFVFLIVSFTVQKIYSLMSFFKNKFIYLFLAALGLHSCAQAFSSCGQQGLLFIVVHGLLIAVDSLVVDHRL